MELARADWQVLEKLERVDSGCAEKRAILVLGMHRSGTSACARSISFCGYTLPADIMPARPDNPKGFWEPLAVARLNDAILTDLGLSWDQPGPALCPSMTLAQSRLAVADSVMGKWGAQAAEALRHSFGSAPAIVIKDPRIALVLPLWMAAVTRAAY